MVQHGNVLIDFTKWLFKWIVIFVVGVVVLAVFLGGGWWAWNWWSYERHKNGIEVVALNSVAPEALKSKVVRESDNKEAGTFCAGSDFPIFVGYINKSSRSIEYVSIDISAHLPDHSTNILEYGSHVDSDRIIEPGGGFGFCRQFTVRDEYKTNPEIAKAIYSGTVRFVRFKDD